MSRADRPAHSGSIRPLFTRAVDGVSVVHQGLAAAGVGDRPRVEHDSVGEK
ncbi:hypothetical protein [Nonomuraea sp. bgisy101]|uniref:hypothetical protein n=1 Tax=Nonomuraea sp. bgisy101 TaxID=3413784 RepID=UPI003D719D89